MDVPESSDDAPLDVAPPDQSVSVVTDEPDSPAPPVDESPAPARLADDPEPLPTESQASEDQARPEEPWADPSTRAQQTMTIEPPMEEIGQAWLDGESRDNFSMPVAGGRDLEIEVERFESIGDEGGAFIGRVKGRPDSSVRLSYRGRAEAGTIRLPSENLTYRIFPGESGAVVVQERDMAQDELTAQQQLSNQEIPPVPNFTPPPPPGEVPEDPE